MIGLINRDAILEMLRTEIPDFDPALDLVVREDIPALIIRVGEPRIIEDRSNDSLKKLKGKLKNLMPTFWDIYFLSLLTGRIPPAAEKPSEETPAMEAPKALEPNETATLPPVDHVDARYESRACDTTQLAWIAQIKGAVADLHRLIEAAVPVSSPGEAARGKSIALTKLEEVAMFATKAVTRCVPSQQKPSGPT